MGRVHFAEYLSKPTRALLVVVVFFVLACTSNSSSPTSTDPTSTTTSTTSVTTSTSTSVPDTSTTTTTPDTSTTEDSSTTTTSTTTTTTLPPPEPPTYQSLEGINTIPDFAGYTASGMSSWERSVPGIEDIRITSSADGAAQPALWLAPGGDRSRPLLVILHSWSAGYLQHAGIPYAMWAQENGWAVIAPQFRGVNDDPEAMGSDLAVQDVVDAIHYATSQEGVDEDRVYAVGYSGGGMMSLLLAGRHPEKVTAVAAWGPPTNLLDFYRQSVATGRHYASDIRAGCGGDPTRGGAPQEECLSRSPITHLDGAREERVAVFLAQGIADSLLSPSHTANAFNVLADPEDRLSESEVDEIAQGDLPDHLAGSITAETYFGQADPEPVFARRSGPVWLVYFNSGHDMAYKATLRWFVSNPG